MHSRRICRLVLNASLATALLVFPRSAGAQAMDPHVLLSSKAIVGDNDRFVALRLQDAVAMALEQNTDLSLADSNKKIAHYQVVSAKGPFDLKFTVAPTYSYSISPAESAFAAGPGGGPITQITAGLNGGFTMTTLGGTTLAVGATASQTQSNSTSNSYDPFYQTALNFSVTQPLGKGRFSQDRRDLLLSIINDKNQSATTLVTASTTVAQVVDAYWDLVAAWRNLGIQRQSLVQALAQASSNSRLVHRGSAAPVDVIESNTLVDTYQDDVASALQNVGSLENQLKTLILPNVTDALWSVNFVPISPVEEIPSSDNPQALLLKTIKAALQQRPELLSLQAQRMSDAVQLAYARDQARPQVDVQMGYTSNGFAGLPGNLNQNPIFTGFAPLYTSLNQLIAANNAKLGPGGTPIASVQPQMFTNPANTTGRFGQSWNSLFSNAYPTYSAQLNVALPLKNDRAIGELGVARETIHHTDLLGAQLLQQIFAQARNAVQAIQADSARLIAARAARLAADRVLESEERKFAVGRSTTFLVLQRQVTAATDAGRELQAQTDLNKAITELDRVSGDIFNHYGIRLSSRQAIGAASTSLGLTKNISR